MSEDYFKTIGVPILKGRGIAGTDRDDAPKIAVINKTMAAHVFPGEDPIGKRIGVSGNQPDEIVWLTIVGISGDVRQYGITNPPVDQIYLSLRQYPGLATACLVRTQSEPLALTRTVREAVHSIGPEQPVDRFRTLEDLHTSALDMPRLTAILLAAFAGLALVITATGIAGVISFTVGQRRQEFGIRMALGALPGGVLRMVLGQGMRLVLLGLAIGVGERVRPLPPLLEHALRDDADRSADLSRRRGRARAGRRRRVLRARAPGDHGRSDGRAPQHLSLVRRHP